MIYRSFLIQLIFDLVEEISIRVRERRLRKEKEEFEKSEKARMRAYTKRRIFEARKNQKWKDIDPSKYEV
jgi:hypothetical protein